VGLAAAAAYCALGIGATFAMRLHLNLLTAILRHRPNESRRQIARQAIPFRISIRVIQRAAYLCGIKAGGSYGRN
jgi:hypothetical protein